MSFYKALGRYEYKEQEIENIKTGERLTACEQKTIFAEDFYAVKRLNYATPNGDGKTKDSLFKFIVMPDGYSVEVIICDYEQARKVIADNLDGFLKGKADTRKILDELNSLKGEQL